MPPAPFVRPEDLPMSPPQSLPPSPPTFAHPSFGPRSTHAFPATPGTSAVDLNATFAGPTGDEERPFQFTVPEGHLCEPGTSTSLEQSAAADEEDVASASTLPLGSRRASPTGAGRKGVFRQAFFPSSLTSSSEKGRSPSHGRSSSISALRKSGDGSSSGSGWRTHSPSESLLGLSGIAELVSGDKRGSRSSRKGLAGTSNSGEASDAVHWEHRRALLPTVSRRGKRLLALAGMIFFVLVLAKFAPSVDGSTSTLIIKRLRKTPANATHKEHKGVAARSSSTASRASSGSLAGWTWGRGEELAALVGFLTSEDTHAIPPMVDGSTIDPELVLDFDPLHSTDLASDLLEMTEHVWAEQPIVILGLGHGDPQTRDVRNMLLSLRTRPAPTVLLVDTRADADQIVPVLERLTSTPLDQFPVLLIGGRKVDPSRWQAAELKDLAMEAGATFIPPKIKRPVPANPNHQR